MTILDRIIETKRREIDHAKRIRSINELRPFAQAAAPARDFLSAVIPISPSGLNLIAEIKRKSPSAGLIRGNFDPVAIAREYFRNGAAALSVLTDETYFGGRLEFIEQVKAAVPLPVLRKDFIIEEYQVYESRAAGADAVLLIVEALGWERVAELAPIVAGLGMTCLIEVHREENLVGVLNLLGSPVRKDAVAGHTDSPPRRENGPTFPYLLGINNRDLSTQRTEIETTLRLSRLLPTQSAFVSESGLSSRADIETVHAAGACAVLIGESLLRSSDIGASIRELLNRPA